MKKWMLLVAGTVSGLTLTASEVLLSHDILAAKPEIDIQKGGAMNALPQGGYRFTLTPETRAGIHHQNGKLESRSRAGIEHFQAG